MYEALTLNPFAFSMTCITTDTSESIPSLTGLNVTVCPSIFSAGIGSLTVGGRYLIRQKIRLHPLGSSKALFERHLQLACDDRKVCPPGKVDNRVTFDQA